MFAQEEKPKYDRKEEIIYGGKLYRVYNNYVSFGGGFLLSSLRDTIQKTVGFDFNFHVRRQYFQVGALMSGLQFLGNSNSQVHACYTLRKETDTRNFAVSAGPCYFTGVRGTGDSTSGFSPIFYQGLGAYACGQMIIKFKYDIGFGMEVFGEYSTVQSTAGIRFVMFFSSAYKGPKKNYNPHVRSENQK